MNPNMVHQIFMEGEVGCPISNLVMCMKKFLKRRHNGHMIDPEYYPCHANGQFFHSQCIQSMLPSIPGNPLFSLIDKRR
jgi:hypothetical protein